MGTTRGRYDEHGSKFSLSKKLRFNQTSRRRESLLKVLLSDYWQGALPASATTWNLHTTQPKYFAPTYSEVVNLTGLAENKGLDV